MEIVETLILNTPLGGYIVSDSRLAFIRPLFVALEGKQYDLLNDSGTPVGVPPAFTFVNTGGNSYNFTISGDVPIGTVYKLVVSVNIPPITAQVVAIYTSIGGDTVNTIAAALYAYVLANFASYAQSYGGGATFTLNFPAGSHILQCSASAPPSPPITVDNRKVAYNGSSMNLRFQSTISFAPNAKIFVFYKIP